MYAHQITPGQVISFGATRQATVQSVRVRENKWGTEVDFTFTSGVTATVPADREIEIH